MGQRGCKTLPWLTISVSRGREYERILWEERTHISWASFIYSHKYDAKSNLRCPEVMKHTHTPHWTTKHPFSCISFYFCFYFECFAVPINKRRERYVIGHLNGIYLSHTYIYELTFKTLKRMPYEIISPSPIATMMRLKPSNDEDDNIILSKLSAQSQNGKVEVIIMDVIAWKFWRFDICWKIEGRKNEQDVLVRF